MCRYGEKFSNIFAKSISEFHNILYVQCLPLGAIFVPGWVPYLSLCAFSDPHPHVPYSPLSAIVILKYHFHPHVPHPLLWVPYLPRCAIPVQLCYSRPWPLLLLV